MRAPRWSENQFAYLYANPGMPAVDLARLMGRSTGAIETVRCFVHSWHRDGNVSGLSKMMLRFLLSHRGEAVCAECPVIV